MRKLYLFLLCGLLFTANLNAQTWSIGYPTATNVTATLQDGTLTISGTGATQDWQWNWSNQTVNTPWWNMRDSVQTVVINNGVTRVEQDAFRDLSNLTSITIGNSVTGFGWWWAFGQTSLTTISVALDNPTFSSIDGVLFAENQTVLVRYPPGRQGTYVIPNTVTLIAGGAFAHSTGLTSVTIPEGVTTIQGGAFANTGLTSIIIPNSVTSLWGDIFYGSTALTSVTIGNGVTDIPLFTFANTGLTSITIPNNVASISSEAFLGSNALASIEVVADNPNLSSKDGVLFNKNQTTLIIYPPGRQGAYTIPNSVTTIANRAFNSTGLTSVTIPSSVITIGDGAFINCPSLRTVINLSYTPQAISSNVFYSVNLASNTLFVAEDRVEAFQQADVWRDFGSIKPFTTEVLISMISTLLNNILQNENLNDSISTLLGNISALQNQISSLNNDISTLQSNISACENANIILQNENNALQTANSTLQNEISDLNSVVSTLQNNISICENENIILQNENNTLQGENSTLQDENNALQTTNSTLQNEINDLNNDISTLQSNNSTCENANIILQNENTTVQNENNRLNNENTILQSTNTILQTANNVLQTTNNSLLENISWLQQLLANCEQTSSNPVISENQIQIFPNPVTHELRIINHDWQANDVVELYDMSGRLVFSERIHSHVGEFIIDMSRFEAGNYILRIGNRVAKVVKL